MLRRWIAEMAAALGQEVPLAVDSAPDEIDKVFSSLLNRISAQRPVVVLIDALNQFEPTTRARHLTWLPRSWPQNARLIATAIPGSQSEALEKRQRAILCALPDLSEAEATEIARAVCARYHRTIGADVLKALLGRRLEDGVLATGKPLWLEIAVEALNLLDADDFARMDLHGSGTPEYRLQQFLIAMIEEMPAGVADLYG